MALLGERVAEAEAARPPPVSEAALHALRDAHAALREQLAVAKRQRGGYERQLEQLVCAKVGGGRATEQPAEWPPLTYI